MISINQIKYRGTNDTNKKIYDDFPIPYNVCLLYALHLFNLHIYSLCFY